VKEGQGVVKYTHYAFHRFSTKCIKKPGKYPRFFIDQQRLFRELREHHAAHDFATFVISFLFYHANTFRQPLP